MSSISIASNDRVFVLTGAGVSAESGLPTFRADDGLWAGNRVEDICTPEAWKRDPARVWEFYSARRAAGEKAVPNPAHIALAELETKLGDRFFLCTQNVDDLHERAARSATCTCTANSPRHAVSGNADACRLRIGRFIGA